MWNKIKKAINYIVGAVLGLLFVLLKVKNKKIEKSEIIIEEQKEEIKEKEIEIFREEQAEIIEDEQAEIFEEIKEKEVERIVDVVENKVSYNDLIRGWNEK